MTTKTYSYTAVVTDHEISTYRPGAVISGPATKVFNAGTVTYQVGGDDVCCGICNVLYPNVVVYYWPIKETNTWCQPYLKTSAADSPSNQSVPTPTNNGSVNDFPKLTGLPILPNLPKLPILKPVETTSSGETTNQPPGANYSGIPPGGFGVEPPLKPRDVPNPTITPSPVMLESQAQRLQIRKFVPIKGLTLANFSDPLFGPDEPKQNSSKASYAIGPEGFTFTSPSVYVVVSTIQAKDKCGTVGKVHTSLTLSFAESQLSTIDGISDETKVFNFADLPCPPTSWNFPNPLQGNTAALIDFAQTYHPRILAPQSSLKALDPAWKSCSIIDVGNGYDPPRPLTPADAMATALPMCSDGKPASDDALYVENKSKHCLDPAGPLRNSFPEKEPVYKTHKGLLLSGADNPAEAGPAAHTQLGSGPLISPAPNLVPNTPEQETQGPAAASPAAAPSSLPQQSLSPTITVGVGGNFAPQPQQPAVQLAPSAPANTEPSAAIPQQPSPENPAPVPTSAPAPAPAPAPVPASAPAAPEPNSNTNSQVQQVVVQGSTIQNNAPPVTIGGQPVALSGGNIYVGSSTAPAPQIPAQPTNPPVVAGGLTLTPASSNQPAPVQASPTVFAGLTFSAPPIQAISPPANPQPNSPANNPNNIQQPNDAKPVVVGGQTYAPVQGGGPTENTPSPVVVGSLTFNPVPTDTTSHGQTNPQGTNDNSPGEPQNPGFNMPNDGSSPGQAHPASGTENKQPIVVGGHTYTPVAANPTQAAVSLDGVTNGIAKPAAAPVVENGVTIEPVPAGGPLITVASPLGGSPANTPLGVVAGQVISGDNHQAVVGGQTILPESVATIAGTPVSLGASNIVIGTNSIPLPVPSTDEANQHNSPLGIVGGQVISGDQSHVVVDGHTILPGSVATISGTPVSLGSSNLVIGTNSVPLPTAAPDAENNIPLGVVGNHVISGDRSHAVVDGQTILPGSAVTISGTPVSLGDSNLVIGTGSVALPSIDSEGSEPSAFSIAGTTVSNGGPPITVSGTRISLGPSGLIVGSSTIPLTNPPQLGEQTSSPKVFSIDGTGVTQGGPAVTISGTRVSLGNSDVIIGSKTIALPSTDVFAAGGQKFTPRGDGFSIDGTTITPGGPAVTIAGTKVSLASGSELVIGSSTFAIPDAPSPTLSVDGQTLTRISGANNEYVLDGKTISPGGPDVTVDGTAVSLNPSNSLLIGSSTIAVASAGGTGGDVTGPLTAGSETFVPIGSTAVSIDGTTISISGPAVTDHGIVISLGSSGLVVGTSTYAFPTPASNELTSVTNGPIAGSSGVFSIDGETFIAGGTSVLSIGSTALTEGGPPVTINGTVISLGTSALVVGASTIPLASVSDLVPALTQPPPGAATGTPSPGSSALPGEPEPTGSNGKSKSAAGKLEIGDWKVLLGVALLTLIIGWILFV